MQRRFAITLAPMGAALFLTAHSAPSVLPNAGRLVSEKLSDPLKIFCDAIGQQLAAQLKKDGIAGVKVLVSTGQQNPDNITDFDVIYKINVAAKTYYAYGGSYQFDHKKGVYQFAPNSENGRFAAATKNTGQPLEPFQNDKLLNTIVPKLQKISTAYEFAMQDSQPVLTAKIVASAPAAATHTTPSH